MTNWDLLGSFSIRNDNDKFQFVEENMGFENIILIGMPASGKSTVGVILVKVLGMDFIDTDIVIQ